LAREGKDRKLKLGGRVGKKKLFCQKHWKRGKTFTRRGGIGGERLQPNEGWDKHMINEKICLGEPPGVSEGKRKVYLKRKRKTRRRLAGLGKKKKPWKQEKRLNEKTRRAVQKKDKEIFLKEKGYGNAKRKEYCGGKGKGGRLKKK